LPGSRNSEVQRLSKPFIDTMVNCQKVNPNIKFIVPLVSKEHHDIFKKLIQGYHEAPQIIFLDGQSRLAMAASDAVLLASGTATLEALLLKKPMIVAYKLAPLTYWIASTGSLISGVLLPSTSTFSGIIESCSTALFIPNKVAWRIFILSMVLLSICTIL